MGAAPSFLRVFGACLKEGFGVREGKQATKPGNGTRAATEFEDWVFLGSALDRGRQLVNVPKISNTRNRSNRGTFADFVKVI